MDEEDDKKLYAFEPDVKGKLCHKGHALKREILTDLRDEYPYYCITCGENYFEIETKEVANEQ